MEAEFVTEAFEFLDDLRDSGVTNMFGACPYLIEEFALTRAEASTILKGWMSTFDGRSVDQRAASFFDSLPA